MDHRSNSYSRGRIAELTGIDDSTLNYWMREGILRAAEGGAGRGQPRIFRFHSVNIAAFFDRLDKIGVAGSALRDLSDLLHASIDFITAFDLSDGELDEAHDTVVQRESYLNRGYCEWPINGPEEFPDQPRGRDRYVRVSWDEFVEQRAAQGVPRKVLNIGSNLADGEAVREWYRHHHNFERVAMLPDGPHARHSIHDLDFIYRGADGRWTIAGNADAVGEGVDTLIAMDLDQIAWKVWSRA